MNEWAESHPEAGAVRVGADHREAVSRQVASTHRKGNEAGEVPGHKVLQREANLAPLWSPLKQDC